MPLFGNKRHESESDSATPQPPREGKAFFAWAQQQVAEALEEAMAVAEEYEDAEEFGEDLFKRVWPVVDAALKASYRNGRNSRRRRGSVAR